MLIVHYSNGREEPKQYRGWFVLVALIIGVGIGYLAGIWSRV